ncbi:hypothetical protein GGQ22_07185 [Nocardioides sp. zg-579]|uniref:Uncharacterized protein n=1 Tax=Nocardioides marmotae TaxID=2663857 RepID=A0A6I3JAL7_9ACTN|nr:hypothetical protein [Nocardioides marmotae]MCR6031227.1 hypothetical protein [Gordonia jinghuaiqii]MTB94865.1 hypothetical protein [Nocardioides marmotae]QKE01154.1 hypothetical protein HPC71_08790 [Nocardioides marmotae]
MSEQSLRDLLKRAVPEAPDLDVAALERRAARERRNRMSVAAGGAVVVAIVAGSLALTTLTLDDGRPPSPSEIATEPPTASDVLDGPVAPYDPPPCPARLPVPAESSHVVPDLGEVAAIRLCPDLNPHGDRAWQPSADQVAQLDDADALVSDLAGFAVALRKIPPGLPDYCADGEDSYERYSFAFYRPDGTRVMVGVAGCEPVTIAGQDVDSNAVRQIYLASLDRQRDTLTYSRPFDDELTCASQERGGPIRPGRERLVAAIACDIPPGAESIPMDLEPVELDARALDELERAWSKPGDPIVRESSGVNECVDLPEPPSFILAGTDRSDVVRLIDSPCGFLVWHGWEDSDGATIPTTLTGLGVE